MSLKRQFSGSITPNYKNLALEEKIKRITNVGQALNIYQTDSKTDKTRKGRWNQRAFDVQPPQCTFGSVKKDNSYRCVVTLRNISLDVRRYYIRAVPPLRPMPSLPNQFSYRNHVVECKRNAAKIAPGMKTTVEVTLNATGETGELSCCLEIVTECEIHKIQILAHVLTEEDYHVMRDKYKQRGRSILPCNIELVSEDDTPHFHCIYDTSNFVQHTKNSLQSRDIQQRKACAFEKMLTKLPSKLSRRWNLDYVETHIQPILEKSRSDLRSMQSATTDEEKRVETAALQKLLSVHDTQIKDVATIPFFPQSFWDAERDVLVLPKENRCKWFINPSMSLQELIETDLKNQMRFYKKQHALTASFRLSEDEDGIGPECNDPVGDDPMGNDPMGDDPKRCFRTKFQKYYGPLPTNNSVLLNGGEEPTKNATRHSVRG